MGLVRPGAIGEIVLDTIKIVENDGLDGSSPWRFTHLFELPGFRHTARNARHQKIITQTSAC